MKKPKAKQNEKLFETAPPPPKRPAADKTGATHYPCVNDECRFTVPVAENICPRCGREQITF